VTILLIFDEISKEKWENQLKLKITKCVSLRLAVWDMTALKLSINKL
jgi:hypothetical protein